MNPARVGDAALSIIFTSYQTKRWKRTVSISKEEINLDEIHLDGQHDVSLRLWGIEPGLVSVKIERLEQGSATELLQKKIQPEELDKFSHIIIINEWCSAAPYIHADSETVEIYRLTPLAKRIISAQNW
ncbi:MAG: hypothetical protein WCK59_04445 [Candidatus Falkowbacteria bacterium]